MGRPDGWACTFRQPPNGSDAASPQPYRLATTVVADTAESP